MKIKPLFDKILLKQNEEKQPSTGIIIPELNKEKPNMGTVVAVGMGGRIDGDEVTIIVKVGDQVLFNKYATSEFKLNNQTYLLIKQADILAVIEE